MSDPQDERAAYIDGLRQLATALEDHPELPLPFDGRSDEISWYMQDDKDTLAAAVRALPCTFAKRVWDSDNSQAYLELTGRIAGLKVKLNAWRDAVCTRRVVGTEEREVEKVVTPAVVEKVTETVDVVEWDCGPLLRPALPAAAKALDSAGAR
ncbi:MAG TPA: hypothetical protein VGS19_29065 [Streptosporangiaceae bacterium]|nr:hypothetical protein [Streptosporangiaceae bacterium]